MMDHQHSDVRRGSPAPPHALLHIYLSKRRHFPPDVISQHQPQVLGSIPQSFAMKDLLWSRTDHNIADILHYSVECASYDHIGIKIGRLRVNPDVCVFDKTYIVSR